MAIVQLTLTTRRSRVERSRLVGELTVLRPVQESDLASIEAWDQDPLIIPLMGQRFTNQSVEQWFEAVSTGRDCLAYAIETQDGTLIGELELAHVNRRLGSAELRICIGNSACWGLGYGSDSLQNALRCAFKELGLRTVYLRVYQSNQRAIRLYLRMGFRKEALLQPCRRRGDLSPILLMTCSKERWSAKAEA